MTESVASPLVAEIKERGFWTIIVRPSTFVERRVADHSALIDIVRSCSVQLRGWDFPHISPHEEPSRGLDWVGQQSKWNEFREVWRAHLSGQFFDLDALTDDWRGDDTFAPPPQGYQSGTSLSVYDVVFRLAEVFEFASRIALTGAGNDQMFVSVRLDHMTGRKLEMSDASRAPFRWPRIAQVDSIPYETELPREDLVARPRELAIEPTRRIFEVFGWDAPESIIREIQAKLWR